MTGGPGAVLVMGEALIDLVPSAQEARTHLAQPGGAPANVAAGLAGLGTRSWYAGALGGDGFARTIEERLVSAGVELGLCARSPLPTALAVADPGPEGTGYHFHLQDTATFRIQDRSSEVGRFGAVYVAVSPRLWNRPPRQWRRPHARAPGNRYSSWTPTSARTARPLPCP
ncbi:PfkB family carbohydrate kinase [Streptomyces sp. NPDC005133]